MAESTVKLFPIALYLTIACCTSLPLYIYGLYKWHQFKQHFMVMKRFPLVSNLIVIVSLITMINEIIRRWLDYLNGSPLSNHHGLIFFRSVASANTFLLCSLPVYRLLLIYLQWKKSQSVITKILNKESKSNPSPPTIACAVSNPTPRISPLSISHTLPSPQSTPHSMPKTSPVTATNLSLTFMSDNGASPRADSIIFAQYPSGSMPQQHVSQPITSVILALFMFLGYFALLVHQIARIPTFITGMIWTCAILCSLFLIIVVKVERVDEGIGCLREAYTIMLCLIINLIAHVISMVDRPDTLDACIMQYISASLLPIFGLLPIYIALFYIKQCEGSLNVHEWTNKFKEEMYRNRNSVMSRASSLHSALPVPPMSRTSSVHTVSALSIVIGPNRNSNTLSTMKQQKEKAKQSAHSVVAALDLKCLDFLKTEVNYKAFATYLGHCFALENLLFMENVNILYAIVKSFKVTEQREAQAENVQREHRREMKRNKFTYLSASYAEYQRKIIKWSMKYNRRNNEIEIGCVEYYKKALFKVHHSIYTTYVQSDAEHEVNLSAEIRMELTDIFEDLNALGRFKSFDDFMHVFDEALIEIYRLVFGIYSYRFNKWCKEQYS
eukprot:211520_1